MNSLEKMRSRPISRNMSKETASHFAEIDRLLDILVEQQPLGAHRSSISRPLPFSGVQKVFVFSRIFPSNRKHQH
jgi:hypothetical protein